MGHAQAGYSTRAYFDQVYAGLRPAFTFRATNREEWRAWHVELSVRLIELLGGFPDVRFPLHARVIERVPEEGYLREKVVFDSEPGVSVPAYVLIPNGVVPGSGTPGILCLHGHGRGKDDVVGLASSPKERHQRIHALNYDYGRQLAQAGYVVLAPDALPFGERAQDGMTCTWAMTAGLMLGKVLVGLRVWDAMRALDYLQTRPEVDPARLGCVGLSWGGTHTLYTAALDERIRVAVISGYFDTFKDMLIDAACCPCQYVPNLLRYAELADIAALIAPRPLLIENGVEDALYTPESVEQEYARLARAYAVLNVPDRLDIDLFPGHHRFSGRKAFDWLRQWL